MYKKRIAILGSTGSIGINTLKVISRLQQKFTVFGLTAYNNFKLLEKQIKIFSPEQVAVSSKGIKYLRQNINTKKIKIFNVDTELEEFVSNKNIDIVVIAMRGSIALKPFLSAVKLGKRVAPANKEALVIAGDIIMKEAKKHRAEIIPIDSEQSAIFQCLRGNNINAIKKILLTASGGPLLKVPKSKFKNMSVEQILKHPKWRMGEKITVDSATLMNKGFEVIEASRLFNVSVANITVVIHPEAIIHSMVEFQDGSVMAQMGIVDMRLPIQYALTYPERIDTGLISLNFLKLKQLTFMSPDTRRFPSLSLAIYAGEKGKTLPAVLNAADEEAVEAFLKREIAFSNIYDIVEKTVMSHRPPHTLSLDNIISADQWARETAKSFIYKKRRYKKQ